MSLYEFALGPVQSFVAQARRTRDFWAGSFLLSWLTTVAIRACQSQGGELLFPKALPSDCPGNDADAKKEEAVNAVPNRFAARVPAGFDPFLVSKAVTEAWLALAKVVWDADLEKLPQPWQAQAHAIWQRQVPSFWRVEWAMPESLEEQVLARRKTWRVPRMPAEGGVSCHLMPGWQELSGASAPHDPQLEQFWATVRRINSNNNIELDLDEHEHLCAIAFIKRRFPRHFERLRCTIDGKLKICGRRLPTVMPSVVGIAAAPWLTRLYTEAESKPNLAKRLDEVFAVARELPQEGAWVGPLSKAEGADVRRWRRMSPNLWYPEQLRNPETWPPYAPLSELEARVAAVRRCAAWPAKLSPSPAPYYAVLRMDGDEMGALLRQDPPAVTDALARFTDQVAEIVEQHMGWPVYAGGDDVLALFPAGHALEAAGALYRTYRNAFASTNTCTAATISAGILYVHIKTPLVTVLERSHQLLDEVAKQRSGRDSVACQLWRPGGQALTWWLPWQLAMPAPTERPRLAELAEAFARKDSEMEGFSSRFFYRLRERWLSILGDGSEISSEISADEFAEVATAEYLRSAGNREGDWPEAKTRVRALMEQCQVARREKACDGYQVRRLSEWRIDGALLVRFLAGGGGQA